VGGVATPLAGVLLSIVMIYFLFSIFLIIFIFLKKIGWISNCFNFGYFYDNSSEYIISIHNWITFTITV